MASVNVKVVWRGPEVQAEMMRGVDRGVDLAGKIILAEVKRLILDTPKTGRFYGSHQASAPGEAPASETGALVSGLQVQIRGNQHSRSAVIISSDPKASMLEFGTRKMAPRPHMTPALINKKAECYAALGGSIRTETAYSATGR